MLIDSILPITRMLARLLRFLLAYWTIGHSVASMLASLVLLASMLLLGYSLPSLVVWTMRCFNPFAAGHDVLLPWMLLLARLLARLDASLLIYRMFGCPLLASILLLGYLLPWTLLLALML
jgi:hypothetical protein